MKKIFFFIVLLSGMTTLKAQGPIHKAPDKLLTCTACHGEEGKATNPAWPNLASQHQKYLIKRLEAYKANKTGAPTPMNGIAVLLSDKDFIELSYYYSQKPRIQGETEEKYLKRGEQLYRGGDFEKKIAACIACHGPQGRGNGQAGFPALSGQNAAYVIAQLEAFKDKKRIDDLNSIMQDIAARMSKEDMVAVANYVQGLH